MQPRCSKLCNCWVCAVNVLRQHKKRHYLARLPVKKNETDYNEVYFLPTDPSPLAIHMNTPDVLCQIGTAAEALWTEVPAAGVRDRLGPGGAGTALSVHHGRGGAATGRRALHFHQGAADTGREDRVGSSSKVVNHGC